MKRIIYILAMLIVTVSSVMGQSDRKFIREGNKLYRSNKYSQAENIYRKALGKNSANPQAAYNLGCALMSQGNDSAAIVQFNNAARMEPNKLRRASSYHNIGVMLQKQKNYGEAIEAYKNALRNNPNDNDTRYNFVMCKRLLKQQQQQQKDNSAKSNDGKNNRDKSKQQNKERQDKDNNNRDKEHDKKQNEQQSKENLERQNAEQLLNAAMQEEKATHERLKKAMRQPSRRKADKNW